MIRLALLTTITARPATRALAAPEKHVLDSSHCQSVSSYDHLCFSTGTGMFSGFAGQISFDAADPATTTLLRSDFGLGKFAPFVSDNVMVQMSVEAMKVE